MTSTNCSVLHLWSIKAHDWTMLAAVCKYSKKKKTARGRLSISISSSELQQPANQVLWDVMHAQTKQPQGHHNIIRGLEWPDRSTLNNETYFLFPSEPPPHLHSDRMNQALPEQPAFRTGEQRNKWDGIDMQMETERKTWKFKGRKRTSFKPSTHKPTADNG